MRQEVMTRLDIRRQHDVNLIGVKLVVKGRINLIMFDVFILYIILKT